MGLFDFLFGGGNNNTPDTEDDGFRTITVDNTYSIDIPSFISSKVNKSDDTALTIRYRSKNKDTALVILDDNKESVNEIRESYQKQDTELLDFVACLTINNMFEDTSAVEIGNYDNRLINNLPAVTFNVIEKESMLQAGCVHSFAIIEGKNNIYRIVGTVAGSDIEDKLELVEQGINTFREL